MTDPMVALAPRPDWKMPSKPTKCPLCGGEVIAEAYIRENDDGDGQGWYLNFACYNWDGACPTERWAIPIDWPFEDEQLADERDLEALGFTVTEEWFDNQREPTP